MKRKKVHLSTKSHHALFQIFFAAIPTLKPTQKPTLYYVIIAGMVTMSFSLTSLITGHGQSDHWPWSVWPLAMVSLATGHGQSGHWPWSVWSLAMVSLATGYGQSGHWPWSVWPLAIIAHRKDVLYPRPFRHTKVGSIHISSWNCFGKKDENSPGLIVSGK